jgi:hypothetical protein
MMEGLLHCILGMLVEALFSVYRVVYGVRLSLTGFRVFQEDLG